MGEAIAGGGERDGLGDGEPFGAEAEIAGLADRVDENRGGSVDVGRSRDVDDGDNRFGRGRCSDQDRTEAERPKRRQRGERRFDGNHCSAFGRDHTEMIDPVSEPRNEDAVIGKHRVAGRVEHPMRDADLGVDRSDRVRLGSSPRGHERTNS
jgi:hypothetical protein